MMTKNKLALMPLALLIMTASISGCTGVVVSGAATGAAIVHDRRTPGTVIDDQGTNWKISQAIYKDKELSEASHINTTVYNGAVLLTGETPAEDLKIRANAIAARISGTDKIYNELEIAAPSSLMSRANDTFITAKIKTAMLNIKEIEEFDLTRVKIVTESGVVYLMGLLTTAEANAVTEKARSSGGVKKVVQLFEQLPR